jgi:hypothetical protein
MARAGCTGPGGAGEAGRPAITTPSTALMRRRCRRRLHCAAHLRRPVRPGPPLPPARSQCASWQHSAVRAVVMDLLLWLIFERACRERGCTTSMSPFSPLHTPTRRPVSVRLCPRLAQTLLDQSARMPDTCAGLYNRPYDCPRAVSAWALLNERPNNTAQHLLSCIARWEDLAM